MPTQDLIFRFLGVDTSAGKTMDEVGGKADAAASSMKKFAAGSAVAMGIVAVASVDMAMKFQASTEMIHTQAGASQAQVDSYRKSILSLAGETATAPEALSEALFHIASTGVQGAQAINELKIAAEGAKVGGADLTDVTNALNSTIVSGIGGVHSYSQAMGALNTIVGTGDMHMEDLAQALGTGVLPVIKAFGVNLPQAGAALATFGDNNIRGAQAATMLRMAVQALAKPVQGATGAFAQMGLTGSNALNHFAVDMQQGGLQKALTDLHNRLVAAGLDGKKAGAILVDAFGKRAGTGLALLVDEYGRFELKLDEIKDGAGSFGSDWTATTKNLSFQFERLRADVDVLAIRIGDALIPAALAGIHGIEGLGNASVATVKFFMQHEVATAALAAVIATALVPALVEATVAMSASAWEAFTGLLWKVAEAASAVTLKIIAMGTATAASVGIAGIALGGLVFAWEKNKQSIDAAKASAQDYVTSLHASTDNLQSMVDATSKISTHVAQIQRQNIQMSHLGPGFLQTGAAAKVDTLQKSYASLSASARQVLSNEEDLSRGYNMSRTQVEALAKANKIDLAGGLTDVDKQFGAVLAAAAASRNPSKVAAAGFHDMGLQATSASQAISDLSNSLDAALGNFLSTKQAQLDFKNDLVTLTGALKKSHDSLTLNTTAGRAARGDYISLAQQIVTTAEAVFKQTNSTEAARKATASMRAELAKMPASGALVTQTAHRIQSVLAGMKASMAAAGVGVGHDFGSGLVVGLNDEYGAVKSAAADLGGVMLKGTNDRIRANSPSKEAALIGDDFVAGLAVGMDRSVGKLKAPLDHVAKLLFEGLTGGWHGAADTLKDELSTSVQNALEALTNKLKSELTKQQDLVKKYKSNLKSAEQARTSAITSLASSISDGADLSNIFGTDANGNPTVGNASSYLQGQVGPLKQFAADLHSAKAKHLSPVLLSQIANLGATQGDQVLKQFLSGQSSISAADAAEAQIIKYSTSAATTVTDTKHEMETLKADRKAVAVAERQEKHLERMDRNIEKLAARSIGENVIVKDGKIVKLTTAEARVIDAALKRLRKTSGAKR